MSEVACQEGQYTRLSSFTFGAPEPHIDNALLRDGEREFNLVVVQALNETTRALHDPI